MGARVLIYDLETTPHVVHAYGLFNQNVGLNQLLEPTRVMGVGAKWHGEKRAMFYSDFHNGHEEMVTRVHALFDEADILVGYNSKKFDTPHMRREFLTAQLPPPSPSKEVDLYQVVARQFKFASNKLAYVPKALGLPQQKLTHSGHSLWVRCMAGDPKAWAAMKRYCLGDVRTTEALYDRVRPWITGHPHLGLYVDDDAPVCGQCGSDALQRRGHATTQLGRYARFQCTSCGKWSRGKKAEKYAEERPI